MSKVAIFDFDGTIVNTITDVALAFNQALKENGYPEHPMEAFDGFVGGNLETVVARMLPEDCIKDKNIDSVKFAYRRIYSESQKENTKPYDGIVELLEKLKKNGWKIAVNSNKGQQLLDELVAELFPKGYFDSVVGYLESRPSKPDACGVELIYADCCETAPIAIYVGDGMSDVRTAINAGIPCVFVNWGQGKLEEAYQENVICVETIEELENVLLDWKDK